MKLPPAANVYRGDLTFHQNTLTKPCLHLLQLEEGLLLTEMLAWLRPRLLHC